MAKTDPRGADSRCEIAGFGGVSGNVGLSADRAAEILNFRILPDGTLEKRTGYRNLFHLNAPLRGYWQGVIHNTGFFFAVVGNKVCMLNSTNSLYTEIYTLTTNSGSVSFAFYADRLYLLDGKSILVFLYGTRTFSEAEGYTPLYGKNWHPTEMGAVNEGRNLINNRIRIHYLNTTGSSVFRLPFTCKAVTRVKINGDYIYNYSFTTGSSTVNLPSELVSAGGTVEIAVDLMDVFNVRGSVAANCRASVFRDAYHETFLCTGSDPGYTIYRSTPTTDEMLGASTGMFGATDPLYIRENTSMSVGSQQHPIMALCQCREQMLVMNDQTLWTLRHTDRESDDMEVRFLRNGIGCCAVDAVTLCGDDPITVQEDGIYRLKFSISNPNIFSEERISEDISAYLTPEAMRTAIILWNPIDGELWFRLRVPTDADGLVWVYSPGQKRWICYDDMDADCLFLNEGKVTFGTPDGDVCRMDTLEQTDAGRAFSARYRSHYFGFSSPELPRRSLRASLCYTAGSGSVGLTLENERGCQAWDVAASGKAAPALLDLRAPGGRYRFLRFCIKAEGETSCRIHFLSLSANY